MRFETVYTMDTSRIKFGPGATREIGYDMRRLGATRVMVVTDSWLAQSDAVSTTLKAIRDEGVDAVLFDSVRVEPSDASFKEAIRFATNGRFDGYVGVGGGSSMDTAKAANLYATYPAEFLAYVNRPIGEGRPVPGALEPMVAVPTTAGTRSETTGVAICDLMEMHVKTGISHHALRLSLGIVDPNNTLSQPKMVTACTGLDVLSHALESLTALPYDRRLAPEGPGERPTYQGANPISDVWAAWAIEMVAQNLIRAIEDPSDVEARTQMALAASFAGIGFGNAGVSLPHAMSYPVAGMAKSFSPEGYPGDHPMVPHGMAVVLNAPASFRFTAPTNPALHFRAARLMGLAASGADAQDAGELVAGALIRLMREAGMPNGLSAVGYGPEDVDGLVTGTLSQERLTKMSPRSATADDLRQLFLDSLTLW